MVPPSLVDNLVEGVNAYWQQLAGLTDARLSRKTFELKLKLRCGWAEEKILPKAFGVFCEATKRTLGMEYQPHQLVAGIHLHYGQMVEMGTGEGKTLAIIMAAYFNALNNKIVHIVAPNNYLVFRDYSLAAEPLKFLKTSVGITSDGMSLVQKKESYKNSILYGTANEFLFDQLNDSVAYDEGHIIQGRLDFSIVDEADQALVDNSDQPVILSTPLSLPLQDAAQTEHLIRFLTILTKDNSVALYRTTSKLDIQLTELGRKKMEEASLLAGLLTSSKSLYSPVPHKLSFLIQDALFAHLVLKKNRDYVVKGGSVSIIEQSSGRLLPSNRWSNTLHQAVEMKEGVGAQGACHSEAVCTPRHYFNKYSKLSGASGTAKDVDQEMKRLYGLNTIIVRSGRSLKPAGLDLVFSSTSERNVEIIRSILNSYRRGQPILVGTRSIDESEQFSLELKSLGVPHELLNAKNLFFESNIIAHAGKPNKITIATSVAGRGVDISMGGSKLSAAPSHPLGFIQTRIKSLGGLKVIGVERHFLRRDDDQLAGRTNRQGGPGSATFFLSTQEKFWKSIFGGNLDPVAQYFSNPYLRKKLSGFIRTAQGHLQDNYLQSKTSKLNYNDIINNQSTVFSILRKKVVAAKDDERLLLRIRSGLKVIKERADSLRFYEKEIVSAVAPSIGWCKPVQHATVLDWRKKLLRPLCDWELRPRANNNLLKHSLLRKIDWLWSQHLTGLHNLQKDIELNAWAMDNVERECELYATKLFRLFIKTLEHHILTATLPAFW